MSRRLAQANSVAQIAMPPKTMSHPGPGSGSKIMPADDDDQPDDGNG